MARFGVGVMHNTINSRFGPKPLVHADYAIGLACGADSFWVADHLNSVLPPSMWTPKHVGAARLIPKMDAHLEPWTILGYLAGRNRLGRMKLGVAVTDTGRRNPAVTAQAAASLHLLTRGRAVLGIGAGERESNAPYGVDWSKPVARFEEAVATIRALWDSNGELVTRDSPFFPLHNATFALPPYRGKWPEIWIAAHGPRMMRATGRYADGWFPGTTRASEYGEQLQIVRTAASDAGRDPMAITPALIRFIVTGRSRDEIDEVVESDIAKVFTLNSPAKDWARHGVEHPMGADFTGVQDLIPQTIDEQTALSFAAKVPRSLVEELFAVGTPDEVVDQIRDFRDYGLRYLVLGNAGAIQPSLRKSATATAPPQPSPWAMFAAMALDLTGVPDPQHFMLPVQQPRLVQILAERVRGDGADLRWGHRLVGFDQHADRVVVHVDAPDGPYELPAKYLVGADGGTSQTRKLAGIDFPGMTSHDAVARMAFGVVPPDDWVDPVTGALDIPGWGRVPSTTPFYRAEHGVFACRQLGGRSMLITLELAQSAQEDRFDDDEDDTPVSLAEVEASVKRVLGAHVPLRPVLPDAPLDMRRFYGINSRIASAYRSGRVFIVGDAAHVHSPLGGPGLNLGLQDAVNLGWKLAAVIAGGADPALLDTYQAERRPAGERVVMHSRAQLALVRPGTEVTALRSLFSELLQDLNNSKRLSDLLSGNDNRYDVGADAHPLAGRWVPDFAVRNGGTTRRVAEIARSGRPLLIDLTEDAVVAAVTSDVTERITVASGSPVGDVSATALLVRPDGYVAWASSAPKPEVDELRRVLRDWFGIESA